MTNYLFTLVGAAKLPCPLPISNDASLNAIRSKLIYFTITFNNNPFNPGFISQLYLFLLVCTLQLIAVEINLRVNLVCNVWMLTINAMVFLIVGTSLMKQHVVSKDSIINRCKECYQYQHFLIVCGVELGQGFSNFFSWPSKFQHQILTRPKQRKKN